jgi:glucosamine-6-phosphate deaminase
MEVIIQKDKQAATSLAARFIAKEIRKNPHIVLGLATGRTMEAFYQHLVKEHEENGLDFSLCRTFNLDEYVGLAPDNKYSYRYYMNEHLFNKVNIDLRNTHIPNGIAEDLNAECDLYEKRIKQCGGIDFQLLGLGIIGHIGFNEPLSALQSRTRQKALTPHTIAQNSPLFDNPADMPKRAITMGIGTILESKNALMVVTGEEKSKILAAAVEGPLSSMVSASALQLHPHCVVIVDEDAAKDLKEKDYYRWIFDNEPEWEEFK